MKHFIVATLLTFSLSALSPSQSFQKLEDGNKRFYTDKAQLFKDNTSRRGKFSLAQKPFAIIVACSDSRVAPEILFDQGIGDLFVIRVAGNVIGPLEMESIDYAAKYLGSSCILVMGHAHCGAVDAVVKGTVQDVRYIAQLINKSVIKAKATGTKDVLKTAIKFNAESQSGFIKQSTIISELMKRGKIDVKPAFYDFSTGKVEML